MEAVLNFQPVIELTEEQFLDFCQLNRDVRYRPQIPVEVRQNLNALSADPLLPGFVLDLSEIWQS